MKMLHSYWAYLAVLLLIVAFVNAMIGLIKNENFKEKDLRISLFTLIVMHIQLLLGLGLYFTSPAYKALKENGMGSVMKDSATRLLAVEHPLMMILAIILITIGWSKHKKQTTNKGKFKMISIFYGLALVFVLSRIPWQQWFGN